MSRLGHQLRSSLLADLEAIGSFLARFDPVTWGGPDTSAADSAIERLKEELRPAPLSCAHCGRTKERHADADKHGRPLCPDGNVFEPDVTFECLPPDWHVHAKHDGEAARPYISAAAGRIVYLEHLLDELVGILSAGTYLEETESAPVAIATRVIAERDRLRRSADWSSMSAEQVLETLNTAPPIAGPWENALPYPTYSFRTWMHDPYGENAVVAYQYGGGWRARLPYGLKFATETLSHVTVFATIEEANAASDAVMLAAGWKLMAQPKEEKP